MENGSISLAMRNPLDAAKEARRLTRAREIAPNRGMMEVTSTAAGDGPAAARDPFAPTADQHAGDSANSPADANTWETVIIRGNNATEKRTFKLSPNHSLQSDESTTTSTTQPAGVSAAAGE
jgi:hypothetical protein